MSYQDVMGMPIRAFWNLNKQVSRLRAEEKLEQIDLFLVSSQNTDPKMIERLRKAYLEKIGEPMKEDKSVVDKDQHTKGLAKLRELRARMREEGS
jgi:hypothetical protein